MVVKPARKQICCRIKHWIMVTLTLLKFSVKINAPKEKVWNIFWTDESYRQWAAAFGPGSYAETDWNEGSKVKFLGEDGRGMFSVIETQKPYSQMTFRHLGVILNGEGQTEPVESSEWEGAKESYFLSEKDGVTELKVEVDVTSQYQEYFNETYPKALENIKRMAED